MSIQFPVVPNVPGVPALAAFPGVANITGSINGTILTINSGIGSVAQGLSLSGLGIDPNTILTTGLNDITTGLGGGIGTALVNIPQSVSTLTMGLSGSLSDLFPDVGNLLGGDTVGAQVNAGPTVRWGIFFDGAPVIEPDSILGVDYKKDWHIADYPIEGGTFETYNKVRLPYEVHVTMVKGGTESERGEFLQTLEDIALSLDLYDVVTPEYTFTNTSVERFDYSRKSTNGVSLLTVTVVLQEVRLEASSEFTSTASPTAQDQVNAGVVQTLLPTPQEVQNYIVSRAKGAF